MKRSFIKSLRIALFFLCLGTTFTVFSDNIPMDGYKNLAPLEKTYITLDQLWIDENGMFVNIAGEVVPVTAVFRNESGLYVDSKEISGDYSQPQYECPNGHPSPHGDGRCNQKKSGCPYAR